MKGDEHLAGDCAHSGNMVFGFDRTTDERSLSVFLQRVAHPDLLDKLVPRLETQEIESVVHLFTGLMKKHLSKQEYHRLFLGNNK